MMEEVKIPRYFERMEKSGTSRFVSFTRKVRSLVVTCCERDARIERIAK